LTWKYLLLGAPLLACGCAHGFYRAPVQERLNDGTVQIAEPSVTAVRGLKPQLRLPCRMAVYLKPPANGEWRWTPEDKAILDQCAAALKKDGIVAEVFPLPEILVGKGDLKELRLAAARCGADALFLVHGAAHTDSYSDAASVLNLTVVGGYLVPSSHKDSLFMMEGVLLDVDNGYVYAAVQAEGGGKTLRPAFVSEEKGSVAMAKTRAIGAFSDELVRRMRSLAVAMSRTPSNTATATADQTPAKEADRTGGRVIVEETEKPAQVSEKPVQAVEKPAQTSEKPTATPITSLPIPKVPTSRSPAIVIPATGSTAPSLLNMGAVPPAPPVEKPADYPSAEKQSGVTSGLIPAAHFAPAPEVPPMVAPMPSAVPVPKLSPAPGTGGLTSGLSSATAESK
jgi:hypothetical protein